MEEGWDPPGSLPALGSDCSWGLTITAGVCLVWGIADSCSSSWLQRESGVHAPSGQKGPLVPPRSPGPQGQTGTSPPHRLVGAHPPVPSRALTSGCTSCSELKKGMKGGRPKWVMERSPVKRLLFRTFWKCRSQMYWKRDQCSSDGPAWPSTAWQPPRQVARLTSMVVRRSNFSASCVM